MAKEEKQEKTEQKKEGQPSPKIRLPGGLFLWSIMAAMILAGLIGGFALAQLLAGTDPVPLQNPGNETSKDPVPIKTFDELVSAKPSQEISWPFEIQEPIIANLDEPGVTRYIRAGITLQISSEIDLEKGQKFLEEKVLVIRDTVHAFFSDLSLEDVRGRRNIERIKKQIRDIVNEQLFKESKPFILEIYFREFAVQ
ncbi:MAG: flagellar basal body-associated FliL family protein [Sedimentisphaerales bacterium]|nr:flagellar basal body-associated FliL family protein [Sedimentisphaerales bacterium]